MTVNRDCNLCSRLCNFRVKNKELYPDFYNGAVPNFGNKESKRMILGLAPGLKGANKTGRPFTGDFAGYLLYDTIKSFSKTKGDFNPSGKDNFDLEEVLISNAVRCVPPENKPTPDEIKTCNRFLKTTIEEMKNLKVILALGVVSNSALLMALGQKKSSYPFSHGAVHNLSNGLILVNSYHPSRYNTQTKRLTEAMFTDVFKLFFSF